MSTGPTYQVDVTPPAAKSLRALPDKVRARVGAAIVALETEPRPHGCEKLSGQKNRYRVRVGDFRIIYAIYDDRLVVIIVDIGNRRDVYRKRGK